MAKFDSLSGAVEDWGPNYHIVGLILLDSSIHGLRVSEVRTYSGCIPDCLLCMIKELNGSLG
jgi:hypothetical protein